MKKIQASSIDSASTPEPVGLYPHAKRFGQLLFLSGIGPRKKGSKQQKSSTLNPMKLFA